MVKNLTNFVKSLDYFGSSIDLNFMGQSQFKTFCGGIITAYLYVTFLLYTIQQGNSFIKKDNYNVSGYTVVDLEGPSEPHNFEKMKGGFMIQLEHKDVDKTLNHTQVLDPSIATLEVSVVTIEKTLHERTLTPLTLIPCTPESPEFDRVDAIVRDKILKRPLTCVDKLDEIELKGTAA